ncbi:MAG: alpha-galactosidase [Planctomycetes bacterium]|nr:alpha-galactosidase [Planctomycetota bacterium]
MGRRRQNQTLRAALFAAAAGMATAAPPPPNAPAEVDWYGAEGTLLLRYRDSTILSAWVRIRAADNVRAVREGEVVLAPEVTAGDRVEQRLRLTFARPQRRAEIILRGSAFASDEAFPAETLSEAQARFPLVRASSGPSRNLRNNAVYDRRWDWMLAGPADGGTRIEPREASPDGTRFWWECRGSELELVFRPLFYQKHKNLPFFQPWNYRIRRDSISGWCSWWAYRAGFTQKDLEEVVSVMAEKRLADYGYRFIQIDDCYQGGSGTPASWLEWNGKFPAGMKGYVEAVRGRGFEPGIWIGAFFRDAGIVGEHPDWFVRKPGEAPFRGPWIEYGIDATVSRAAETLVRPTYRGVRQAGFTYVKIDALRHLLYDSLHKAPEHAASKGLRSADIFRRYLSIAREELGPETFILACWGVLPEAIGIADGCRLGTDGFGPCTMQQYNSWNGVVWRSDPDHCDVLPGGGGARRTTTVTSGGQTMECPNETLLRPCLASLASAMLMLSDRADVYRDDRNLEGARRASPVLFTVPGQLYDVDPRKSDGVIGLRREDITTGGPPSPIDADQRGAIIPWWMLEIARPFETWTILARMNWTEKPMGDAMVRFADLGLPADGEYIVHEFWSHECVPIPCCESFRAERLDPLGIRVYAIRAALDRPQIVSTSRHITQGGVDLESVEWKPESCTLAGRSRVVRGDPYEIAIHNPWPFVFVAAEFDGKPAGLPSGKDDQNRLLRFSFLPDATRILEWSVRFRR